MIEDLLSYALGVFFYLPLAVLRVRHRQDFPNGVASVFRFPAVDRFVRDLFPRFDVGDLLRF